jgi:hypothetical protein
VTFSGAIDAVKAHLVTSGATLTPPVTLVQIGEPIPAGNCLAVWYEGDMDAPHFEGGRTLRHTQVGEKLTVRGYWKVPDRSSTLAELAEKQAQAFRKDIRGRLEGDHQLGGTCDELVVDPAVMGWASIDGAWFRTIEFQVVVEFTDDAIIAA